MRRDGQSGCGAGPGQAGAGRSGGAIDPDAFGDLFADDGVWEIGEPFPSRAAGRQNVTTMFKNLGAPWDFFFQMTHSGVIDVAADRQTATARWEIQEIA